MQVRSTQLIFVLALVVSAAQGCPYMANRNAAEDKTSAFTTHTRGASQLRQLSRAQPTMWDKVRKFLNKFDLFGIIKDSPTSPRPRPSSPTAPTPTTPVSTPTTSTVPTAKLTTSQIITAARADITTMIAKHSGMAAKLIRLSFHDCVGGCDGCLDMTSPANNGLHFPITELQPIVDKYPNTTLTRADVWALAGLVAAEYTQTNTSIAFTLNRIGRPVCANGTATTGPERVLPRPHITTQQLLDFFSSTFNFTEKDSVAIMGAHTLGKATLPTSGFNGELGWGTTIDTLDNDFYRTLFSNGGIQTNLTLELQNNTDHPPFPDQFLWRLNPGTNRSFMMNSDMALAVDMAGYLDPDSGAVNCSLRSNDKTMPTCPSAKTLATGLVYANDNVAWIKDFRDAFVKMINTGCNETTCTVL